MAKYLLIELMNTYICPEGKEHEIKGALKGQAYMILDDAGTSFLGYKNIDGSDLVLPEIQESKVIDKNAKKPDWAE